LSVGEVSRMSIISYNIPTTGSITLASSEENSLFQIDEWLESSSTADFEGSNIYFLNIEEQSKIRQIDNLRNETNRNIHTDNNGRNYVKHVSNLPGQPPL